MPDIVGTLAQPHYALLACLLGIVTGVVGFIIKKILSPKSFVKLFIGDFLATILTGSCTLIFCFHYLQGVYYLYPFLCVGLSYSLTYFVLQKLFLKLKKLFKKS